MGTNFIGFIDMPSKPWPPRIVSSAFGYTYCATHQDSRKNQNLQFALSKVQASDVPQNKSKEGGVMNDAIAFYT